jgi:tight adherence protein B
MRLDAGWQTPAQTITMGLAAASLLMFVLAFLITQSMLVSLCAGAAVIMAFSIIIKQAISKRARLFERQLVDALELAARSLRVGQPLVGSFSLIAEEISAPVGPLFAAVCQQQGMGMGLDEAIRVAGDQSGSADMKFFATSVIIQLRSGGNLADMMERLAFVIRDRMRLARRVRVLTAQTQFSKRVLQALPFIVFVVLSLINPEYMQPLYTTDKGKFVLGLAASGLILGTWTMNRLAVIRY